MTGSQRQQSDPTFAREQRYASIDTAGGGKVQLSQHPDGSITLYIGGYSVDLDRARAAYLAGWLTVAAGIDLGGNL